MTVSHLRLGGVGRLLHWAAVLDLRPRAVGGFQPHTTVIDLHPTAVGGFQPHTAVIDLHPPTKADRPGPLHPDQRSLPTPGPRSGAPRSPSPAKNEAKSAARALRRPEHELGVAGPHHGPGRAEREDRAGRQTGQDRERRRRRADRERRGRRAERSIDSTEPTDPIDSADPLLRSTAPNPRTRRQRRALLRALIVQMVMLRRGRSSRRCARLARSQMLVYERTNVAPSPRRMHALDRSLAYVRRKHARDARLERQRLAFATQLHAGLIEHVAAGDQVNLGSRAS